MPQELRSASAPDLSLAKRSCKHCYGTGFMGTLIRKDEHNNETRIKMVCPCVAKAMAKKQLAEASGGKEIPIKANLYKSFFSHFEQGYSPGEIEAFYAEKDRLVEDDARRRQGAFFTPKLWVDEAHRMIESVLGAEWRSDCIVWDCAAGTANLTRDYDFKSLIISTAELPDVKIIQEQGYNPGSDVFAYDFLNEEHSMLFEFQNVIPVSVADKLKDAADQGRRLVFFVNPPFGTANNDDGAKGSSKKGIALTNTNEEMQRAGLGAATQQLYAQFLYRCFDLAVRYKFKEYTVAFYSVPTFMCSGSYRQFRAWWYKRLAFQTGMLFQASHFSNVVGEWGVSFTIWSNGTTPLAATFPLVLKDIGEFRVIRLGSKTLYNVDDREASAWVRRAVKNLDTVDAPQMSSGLKIKEAASCRGRLVPNALAYMTSVGNNIMKSRTDVYITSSCSSTGNGFSIVPENFLQACALFAVRKLVLVDWINNKDEYLAPTSELEASESYRQWNDDSVIWTTFDSVYSNCTAMRNIIYKGKTRRIKNHFWWKSLDESRALYDHAGCSGLYADIRSETKDSYLSTVVPNLKLSCEGLDLLRRANDLLIRSLQHREVYASEHPELHLGGHDAGIYQLKHLWKDLFPDEWKEFKIAFDKLGNRLRPGVYAFGWLRE